MNTRTKGLLFLGATAVTAGCGGGGSQSPGAAGRYVPPISQTFQMTTASLTVQIPAKRTQAARRNPKWVSPSSSTLGVRVLPVPLPNPTPTEQVFALPSPGPAPTSTTLQVTAPVSNDTFVVTAYDGGGHPLSTGSSGVTAIAPNVANTVPVTMLGVASGVMFSVNGSSTPSAWRVLTNLGADQTASIAAAPVDAQNNLIPGTLAAPAAVNGTGGVQLSAATITGATTLTATYPHGTAAQGSVTTPLSLNSGASALNVNVNADSYIFALNVDSTVQVIDVLSRTQVGATMTGVPSNTIAALSGCSTGAGAVEGSGMTASSVAIPAPTVANPTPPPTMTTINPTFFGGSNIWTGIGADSACNLYFNDSSTFALNKLSGFDSGTITANTSFATGFNKNGQITVINGQVYLTATDPTDSFALAVPTATGGAAQTLGFATLASDNVTTAYVAGAGSSVFLVTNACSGQPVLQMLSGGPAITLTAFASGSAFPTAPAVAGAAEAGDGTVYLAGYSASPGNPAVLAYAPIANIGSAAVPTIPLGASPLGVLVTPDQQFVCVLEGTASTGQIEFFHRTPTPTLVGTAVALSGTSAPTTFSIGP